MISHHVALETRHIQNGTRIAKLRHFEHRAAVQIVIVLPRGNKLSQQVVAEWLPQGAGC